MEIVNVDKKSWGNTVIRQSFFTTNVFYCTVVVLKVWSNIQWWLKMEFIINLITMQLAKNSMYVYARVV